MPHSAAIITGPGFQDHDVVYTYYRLLEEGWTADVATKDGAPSAGSTACRCRWTRLPGR